MNAPLQALSDIWYQSAAQYGDVVAVHDPHNTPEIQLTYQELTAQMDTFAAALQHLGVQRGDKVALFADNSPRWLVADQGTMKTGATNVVRSAQAERLELLYIYSDSDSTALIVEDLKTLAKLRPELDDRPVNFIILLSDETPPQAEPTQVLNFNQVLELGAQYSLKSVAITPDDLATLIYTSGTTGKPKGVMLSHGNLLHQVRACKSVIHPRPGDRVLSILPSWHSYERSVEYFLFANGCSQTYTNIRFFKKDLTQVKPHFMVGVPRLWESIYEGVQKTFREQPAGKQKLVNRFFKISTQYIKAKRIAEDLELEHPNPSPSKRLKARIKAALLSPLHQLGDRLVYQKVRAATGGCVRYFVSGGGSLARHIDLFYEIVNVPIIVGYGLTETSPVVTVRDRDRNLRGASGQPLPDSEVKIVDLETCQPVPAGQKGLVLLRGPQIMQGYYNKPEATAKAIDAEGWFDSGDIGLLTHGDNLVITGRAKDTIVLSNGENIEPQPLEDVCVQSPYIDQIMVVGQDQKQLGALIVPNLETVAQWLAEQQLELKLPELGASDRLDLDHPKIQALFAQELRQRVKDRPGYRRDDQIGVLRLILEPFTIENGLLTQTLKVRRPVVSDRYHAIIDGMFQ
ncbi:MAG: AMP-binding protein [Spirulina sp. SIO3F2]|nr:AMP-binding protein [Spirulina sp. SIO3F2]